MADDLTIVVPPDGLPGSRESEIIIRNWRESRLRDHCLWFANETSHTRQGQSPSIRLPDISLDGRHAVDQKTLSDCISILNGKSRLGDGRHDLESLWAIACTMWRLEFIPDDKDTDILGEESGRKLTSKYPLQSANFSQGRCWHSWPPAKDDEDSAKLLQLALFVDSETYLPETIGRAIGRCKDSRVYRKFFTDCTEDKDIARRLSATI
jgi:hypothetical protein